MLHIMARYKFLYCVVMYCIVRTQHCLAMLCCT